MRYSTLIHDSFKTLIQATTTTLNTLNTADGLPMTALGMTALHLRIAEFKFTHNFIILINHMHGTRKRIATFRRMADSSHTPKTANKRSLKIPPRHNGIIPIKIKGHSMTGQTACFISDQESRKGKDPIINIVNGIHNIKGRTSVNILVSNYSNKHVTFNKGEYIVHLENINEEMYSHPHENSEAHTTSSIATKKTMLEQVKQHTFEPPTTNTKQTLRPSLKHF